MKELISIYVSLFLVFSPAFAQTKFSAGASSDEVKDWTVTLSNGAIHSDVQFRELRGDYLDISEMGLPRTLDIGSIAYISSTTKVKSHRGMGAKKGFITGVVISVTLAVAAKLACNDTGDYCYDDAGALAGFLIGVGGPTALGALIGSFFKYVEEYDMSDLSIETKRELIQKLIEREK